MSEQENNRLREVIKDVVTKIRKFQDRNMGEQNTKATLIDPVLEALGWDVRDPDEVYREYKPTPKDSPVDYALTILRKPRLFVEAKGLGETLADRKWIAQVLGYATVAGVEWCVLTDGDEYRFYNATAPLDAEEKLFYRVQLTAGEIGDVAKTLILISRSNMEENILAVRWIAHYVDRRVKQAIQGMFSSADRSLVRVIRKREPKLNPKDIVESLRRLDIRIESATPLPEPATTARKFPSPRHHPVTGKGKERVKAARTKKHFGVSLSEVIGAGLLSPPLRLFRKYKGQIMEATLLQDGSVEMRGTRYPSCSTAAEIARSFVTGQKMHTNGWDFWQYLDERGRAARLLDAREKYLESKKEA
jgi:predicted type IV restriction endonuclease